MAMAGTGVGVGSDGLGGRQRQEQEGIEMQNMERGGTTAGGNGGTTADGDVDGAIGGVTAVADGNRDGDKNVDMEKWRNWRNGVGRKRQEDSISATTSELERVLDEAKTLANTSSSGVQATREHSSHSSP